ncbi:unnamed protein product [Kluyveromyces dobzhanskii CBS 2104]|uniref:WGS project CCBQ000000000 data, contig 00049 n=1 Tax=Kluyveromyces dobzhanskii CBS 2104 TaxID=1427455 RepID=A0A0A8L761_9SACH|nr:unnamed protein product [Kluyveromyces dobzhanskii CBS 2104]
MTVINYKRWWVQSNDLQQSNLLAILCFYDIEDVPQSILAGFNENTLRKLRVLSLLSLCETSAHIKYEHIKEKCDVKNDEDVEELLIQVQLFVDLKIDSVTRTAAILKHKASRDIYGGEKTVPFGSPVRSKTQILSELVNWKRSITD